MINDYSWPQTSLNIYEALFNMKYSGQFHIHLAFVKHTFYGRPLTENIIKWTPCHYSFGTSQMTEVINKRVLGLR